MYYIYEIKGVKIGCTQDLERRQKEQRDKGEMVALEYHTNIEDATRRERELQAEKGYATDEKSYSYVVNVMQRKALEPEAKSRQVKSRDYSKLNKLNKEYQRKNFKPIYAIKDNITSMYESISECSRQLSIPGTYIQSCLGGRQKTAKGYTFKYV